MYNKDNTWQYCRCKIFKDCFQLPQFHRLPAFYPQPNSNLKLMVVKKFSTCLDIIQTDSCLPLVQFPLEVRGGQSEFPTSLESQTDSLLPLVQFQLQVEDGQSEFPTIPRCTQTDSLLPLVQFQLKVVFDHSNFPRIID